LGNIAWLIRAGGRLLAFDLDLDPGARLRPSPVTAHILAPYLDAQFITHEHGDHFNGPTSTILVRESPCLFVVPASCLAKARALGVPEERILVATPGEPLGLAGDVRVAPLRALHGHRQGMVYRHANLDDCGYLMSVGGTTFLQPGDTLLLDEHLDHQGLDVLFVSPTEHNMHVEHSRILIETLRPRFIFPQHFGTYEVTGENAFWTVGYPDELKAGLPQTLQERYHRLEIGQVFVLEAG
jgi:L-ascorbate metabolism protein UlaG (beta-lactamase superfamily)